MSIPTDQLVSDLAFESKEALMKFLEPFNLKYSDAAKSGIDCKSSMASLASI